MREVGNILNITSRTAMFHKYRIQEIVGANSNAELVCYAVKHHLVSA
jgi:DNA-binding CsgD family transcriptional regulator